jgi:hypothetical protein
MTSRIIHHRWFLFAIAILLLIFLIPAFIVSASTYQAMAAGIQSFGLIVTLVIATVTLTNDSRDKRTDRVMSLYDSLVGEAVYSARMRLSEHLKAEGGGKIYPVTQRALREDKRLSKYPATTENTPLLDLHVILRFFERANALQIAGAVDLPLLYRLIGRNILWWDRAITFDPSEHLRLPLRLLAEWVRSYPKSMPNLDYTDTWLADQTPEFHDGLRAEGSELADTSTADRGLVLSRRGPRVGPVNTKRQVDRVQHQSAATARRRLTPSKPERTSDLPQRP